MKEEISAAVTFLTNLVGKNECLRKDQVDVFRQSLRLVLTERFKGHWFPDKPFKGQAYRCIRVNETEPRDPVLEKAAKMCGLKYENLNLPVELTIWVDPQEVCCRFGEQEGSYCTVASFINKNKENCGDKRVMQDFHKMFPLLNQKKSYRRRHIPTRTSYSQQGLLKQSCFEWNPPLNFAFPHDPFFPRRSRRHSRHERYHWPRT